MLKPVISSAILSSAALAQSPQSLQQAVDKALGKAKGSIVVLEVKTGELLASKNLSSAATKLAAPGSTLKPFTVLALQKSPGFDPNERVLCRRKVFIGPHDLRCSHPPTPASLNAAEAIAYSCNHYFADRAQLLAKDALVSEFGKRDFTSVTGLAPSETPGRMRTPKTGDETKLLALGTRLIEITPLQLAVAYRRLLLTIDDPANAIVASGLRSAVLYGMASGARSEAITVAGKTGTASARGSSATHGWFVGYAPADKPEIVVVIFLDRGRGLNAASYSRAIFEAYATERKKP